MPAPLAMPPRMPVTELHGNFLRTRVAGQDGQRGVVCPLAADLPQKFLNPGFDLHNRQRRRSGGSNKRALRYPGTQPAGDRGGHRLGVNHPEFPGAGVGVTGVGNDRAGLTGFDMHHVESDRRGFDLVFREHRRDGRGDIGDDQGEVFFPVFLIPGRGRRPGSRGRR